MFYIKDKLPQIKSVGYFSDDCARQYKNCKAFMNLCHHNGDFDIYATCPFFCNKPWKSLCDTIFGNVKHKLLIASFQRPINNQTLKLRAVKGYWKMSMEGITFVTIDKEDMVAAR